MSIEITDVIVHKVKKEQQEKASIKLRGTSLPFKNQENDTTFRFVEDFSRFFKDKRKTSRIYGEFMPDKDNFPVSGFLADYRDKKTDFLETSKKIANRFYTVITGVVMATGGYVFCIDYQNDDERHFAIVILTIKNGTSIDDESLDLLSSFTLDVDSINMAVDVKFSRWVSGQSGYLTFIRGKKGITDYFTRVVGCSQTKDSRESTRTIISSVKDFIEKSPGIPEEVRKVRKEQACDIMYKLMSENRTELSMNAIAVGVFPDEELREKYFDHVEEMGLEIPAYLAPSKSEFDKLKKLGYKKNGIDLKIDFETFADHAIVDFQPGTDYLIIKDPQIKRLFEEQ